jgi:orotidine-5'-phosphate decarboxylase
VHPYSEKLLAAMKASRSLLCVGLDPDPARMPVPDVVDFNRAIVDATADLVCAYKPNLAFYEALGVPGLMALESTIEHIRSAAPNAVLIGDGKRGDVGSTSAAYARAMFEVWGFDATTVNAWGGGESLAPFFDYPDRGVYVWCRSSNPGSAELQDLRVQSQGRGQGGGQGERLFERLANDMVGWKSKAAIGLVAGAPYPEDVAVLRGLMPGASILAPGVGEQGGSLEGTLKAGMGGDGRGLVINSSRGILYAFSNSESGSGDFAEAARAAAANLREDINRILVTEGHGW